MNKSGIYCITNSINGKRYIGSSRNITTRFYTHRNKLKKNKHWNINLQCDYNDNKGEVFLYEIVNECEEKNLIQFERFYISFFNANNENTGYNIGGASGHPHSQLTKDKISESNRGRKQDKSTMIALKAGNDFFWLKKMKKILQCDKSGNILEEYHNIRSAVKDKPWYKKNAIQSCCSGNSKSAYGFIWRYKN